VRTTLLRSRREETARASGVWSGKSILVDSALFVTITGLDDDQESIVETDRDVVGELLKGSGAVAMMLNAVSWGETTTRPNPTHTFGQTRIDENKKRRRLIIMERKLLYIYTRLFEIQCLPQNHHQSVTSEPGALLSWGAWFRRFLRSSLEQLFADLQSHEREKGVDVHADGSIQSMMMDRSRDVGNSRPIDKPNRTNVRPDTGCKFVARPGSCA
jgi:hypothetical protein